jgi:hypothetical protein
MNDIVISFLMATYCITCYAVSKFLLYLFSSVFEHGVSTARTVYRQINIEFLNTC